MQSVNTEHIVVLTVGRKSGLNFGNSLQSPEARCALRGMHGDFHAEISQIH